MIKKIKMMMLMLVVSLTTIAPCFAFADNSNIESVGDVSVDVVAYVNSTWAVSLPTVVSLVEQADGTMKGTYSKVVSGILPEGKTILVEPKTTNIVLECSNRTKIGTIEDTKTSFASSDLSSSPLSCSITAPAMDPGEWRGTMVYNISIN